MATEHWFRWHHATVTDPKWKVVALRAEKAMSRVVTVGHVVAVWAAMMECASQSNPRGELVSWVDEDVAAALGIPEEEVAAIRAAMQGKTLDGTELIAWKRRQVKAEDTTAADRKRAQRERDKEHEVTARKIESRNVTGSHDRVEESREEEKEQEQSSLRSDSSSAKPTTNDELAAKRAKAEREAIKAQRLATVTDDAMLAFNALLAKPHGLLAAVTDVGIDSKRKWVKRCIEVARQICSTAYDTTAITPEFWREYFAHVYADEFKSGRSSGGKDHGVWIPTFEYLTRPAVMTEVFERVQSEAAA